MKVPRPDTRIAMLPSQGYGRLKATRHVYVRTQTCQVPGPDPDAWEHIFKCSETGEERRWGIVERRRGDEVAN